MTEFEFVRALSSRRQMADCAGPVVRLTLPGWQINCLTICAEAARSGEFCFDRLITDTGSVGDGELCAAHWIDTAFAVNMVGRQFNSVEALAFASHLLALICRRAGWDAKELANLLTWLRVKLT